MVGVARGREPGVTVEQIARDLGVHTMPLQSWLRRAAVDEGAKPGHSRTESADLREARKRIRLLVQENEILRRAAAYLSQANLPGKGSTRS
ncbi:transposase [Salinibacterium sp.]|uniref:transposase n=1 Tax=Salinibacterium sp. TaxID=1915057 RepID=UPI0037C98EBE